jgi:RNA polymerase sigma factor (sigma-70 family)
MSTSQTKTRLADWFLRWRSPLRKFLLGRGAVPLADLDDVAQEVFLRLMRYERAELIEHPQAYLFQVATNVAAEWATRARRRHPHEPKWLGSLLAGDAPEDNVERDAAQDTIERALQTLTPRQRAIVKLHYADGLGHAQIAECLGATPRMVKRDLIKTYQRLRLELDADLIGVLSHGRE